VKRATGNEKDTESETKSKGPKAGKSFHVVLLPYLTLTAGFFSERNQTCHPDKHTGPSDTNTRFLDYKSPYLNAMSWVLGMNNDTGECAKESGKSAELSFLVSKN
jgi:hypothetical protein